MTNAEKDRRDLKWLLYLIWEPEGYLTPSQMKRLRTIQRRIGLDK